MSKKVNKKPQMKRQPFYLLSFDDEGVPSEDFYNVDQSVYSLKYLEDIIASLRTREKAGEITIIHDSLFLVKDGGTSPWSSLVVDIERPETELERKARLQEEKIHRSYVDNMKKEQEEEEFKQYQRLKKKFEKKKTK